MGKINVKNLNIWFTDNHVIKDVSLELKSNSVTAFMGPSGCGKTTFLRAINRLNDLIVGSKTTGEIRIDGQNIYDKDVEIFELRRRVGMVFQKLNPFPKSIYDNIAYGPRIHGLVKNQSQSEEIVETSLIKAGLWDEVKDRLNQPGTSLSGGQQQRLCIARAIAVNPEVILMDEPCSALDPIATQKIEELIQELKREYTIAIVTHNMQQAARVSDVTAFFYIGKLIEVNETNTLFTRPILKQTEDYITGRFG